MKAKPKTRIVVKSYFNENLFFIIQIYEKSFKKWITYDVASSRLKAEKIRDGLLNDKL